MNWHARLAERRGAISPKGPDDSLTKPTKGAFVSFGSDLDGHAESIAPDASPDAIRSRLLALAASEGLPASVVDTIVDHELPLYAEFADADLLLPLHLRARCSLCGGKDWHDPEAT